MHKFLRTVLAFSFVFSAQFAFSYQQQQPRPGQITDDSDLVRAVRSQKAQFYIEAGNLVVTKLLPDDRNGLKHQKWEARLSNGEVIQVVYNSDMGDRVPVKIGDKFGVGGQFVWGRQRMGVMHWLHEDKREKRPDGYVFFNGTVYGISDFRD